MTRSKLYEFDGQMLSAAEVQQRAPVYGIDTIRRYLVEGAKTVADLHAIAVKREAASRAQAKKNAITSRAKSKANGTAFVIGKRKHFGAVK